MAEEHNYNVYAIARGIMEDVQQFVEENIEADGKDNFDDEGGISGCACGDVLSERTHGETSDQHHQEFSDGL